MSPRRINAVALALLAATALGALLAGGLPSPKPAWAAWVVAALSIAKGALVALVFMGLAQAPPLWRRLVLGWLVGVWLAMGVAGWLGAATA
ncbi:MAG: cytochrome C oxidase subunit IV family protein [Proteobacteria bacterium]|nr:cytochrome C oxidase subunit IV family protein [Pseudomonadota bacterium]